MNDKRFSPPIPQRTCLSCKHHRYDIIDKHVHCGAREAIVVGWFTDAKQCKDYALIPNPKETK